MFKIITILSTICIGFILAQTNILDTRYGNRIPSLPPYLGFGYNTNTPGNPVNNNNGGLVDEFGQCGGLDWEGPKTCQTNLVCF